MTQALRLRHLFALFLLVFCSGCAASHNTHSYFVWGGVRETLSGVASPTVVVRPATNKYAALAASLREPNEALVTRYAPTDKDWRVARGISRAPAIVGAAMTFAFDTHATNLHAGLVKRGAKNTFGPQFVFALSDGR